VPGRWLASHGALSKGGEFDMCLQLVEAYSRADLTYWTDKLIALSGIAREDAAPF
jgi:hypothetical protein